MRKYFSLLLFCSMAIWGSAQNVGDLYTASFDGQRTGLNPNMGNLTTPIKLIRAVPLPAAVVDPRTVLPFENTGTSVFSPRPGQSVVVLGDITASGEAHYFIFGVLLPGTDPMCPPPDSPDCVITIFDMDFGPTASMDYVPSYAQDIVLLGGASTLKAVNIASMPNADLAWTDGALGETDGRDPLVTGNLALYHGSSKVAAREADSGIVLWEVATSTAEAPLVMQGERVFFLGQDGVVNALNSADGSSVWSSPPLGLVDGTSIISTEKYIFLAGAGTVGALDARDGSGPVWSAPAPGLATNPGIALAYGQLFVFQADNVGDGSGVAEVRSYNPDCNPGCGAGTGQLLWSATEDSPGLDYAAVANNQIWYYNSGSGRVRVRDAFSGDLLWSIERPDLRALALSDELVLFVTPIASSSGASARGPVASSWQVEVLKPTDQRFFAQMANGEGQSTLIALSNVSGQEIPGTVNFFDINGDPLPLPVDGVVGDTASVPFSVPAQGSTFIQTLGGNMLERGWIRVDPACEGTPGTPAFNPLARCPGLRGSSLFQFTDAGAVLFEAGVGQAGPTGQAVIAVQVQEVPTPQGGTQLLSTGIAFANPADEAANITLTLKDSTGMDVASLMLPPFAAGEQLARFIQEIFPTEVGTAFQGSLLIQSDIPLIITALRTGGGFQLSSFEVGQSQ